MALNLIGFRNGLITLYESCIINNVSEDDYTESQCALIHDFYTSGSNGGGSVVATGLIAFKSGLKTFYNSLKTTITTETAFVDAFTNLLVAYLGTGYNSEGSFSFNTTSINSFKGGLLTLYTNAKTTKITESAYATTETNLIDGLVRSGTNGGGGIS